MNLIVIEDVYSLALQTKIRTKNIEPDELKKSLNKLGYKIGTDIVADNMVSEEEVITPMEEKFKGFSFSDSLNLVYSTKDDYEYFAKGITEAVPTSYQGYFDFQGVRGVDALTQPIRAVSHPIITPGAIVDTVIIAKSVLATGCTAIPLANNIINKYHPRKVIIASAFYSQIGISELFSAIPSISTVYTVGKPDILNKEGMLLPGVGNLDKRLTS